MAAQTICRDNRVVRRARDVRTELRCARFAGIASGALAAAPVPAREVRARPRRPVFAYSEVGLDCRYKNM